MRARQTYSKEFKEAIVRKILNRGGLSISQICEKEGVQSTTASKWLRDNARVSDMVIQKSSLKWSAEEKLKVIIATDALSEQDLGIYLRTNGVHAAKLSEWREDVVKGLAPVKPEKPSFKKDERDEKIKALEKEIRRKDKALSEASALLILQKKVDLIWGNKGADEK